jgi:hypothetical protein
MSPVSINGYLQNNSCALVLTLVGLLLGAIVGDTANSGTFLKPPGLRLINDPSTVIPATYYYLNQKLHLPRYRDAAGIPIDGWSRELVKTRRFSSDQSAWVYYRISDLERTKVIKTSGILRTIRIWPVGTTIVLEGYKGDASRNHIHNLLEIEVMTKMSIPDVSAGKSFYAVNWSYARFTPDGISSLSAKKLSECHQCHSIAFHLTGDLLFTQFP